MTTVPKTNVNFDRMNDLIATFDTRIANIDEIFKNVDKDMKRLKDEKLWTGKTSEIIYDKYELLRKNYPTIIKSLNILSNYMSQIVVAFEDLENRTKSDASKSDLQV